MLSPQPYSKLAGARAAIAMLAAAALSVAACSSGGGTEPKPDPKVQEPVVASVSLAVDTLRLTIGRTLQVTGRALDASGAPVSNVPLTFALSDTAVARVADDGSVSARRFGATALVVSAGTARDTIPVIVRFDTLSITRVPLNGGPFGVAVSADAFVVTQKDGAALGHGSVSSRRVVGGLRVGSIPTDVAINEAGTEAYVTNQYDGNLGFVDLARREQVATVNVPGSTFRSIRSRDGKRVWVTTSLGSIYAVDVATRRVVDSLQADGPVNGFAVARGDTLAYASTYGGKVFEFDLRTGQTRRVLTALGVLQEVVVSGDGRELYVANESGGVEVFNLASGRVVTRLPLGLVFGMALGPDQRTLFVARSLEGYVAAVDRETRQVLFEAPIGGMPRRLAFNAEGNAVIVANETGWVDFLR